MLRTFAYVKYTRKVKEYIRLRTNAVIVGVTVVVTVKNDRFLGH